MHSAAVTVGGRAARARPERHAHAFRGASRGAPPRTEHEHAQQRQGGEHRGERGGAGVVELGAFMEDLDAQHGIAVAEDVRRAERRPRRHEREQGGAEQGGFEHGHHHPEKHAAAARPERARGLELRHIDRFERGADHRVEIDVKRIGVHQQDRPGAAQGQAADAQALFAEPRQEPVKAHQVVETQNADQRRQRKRHIGQPGQDAPAREGVAGQQKRQGRAHYPRRNDRGERHHRGVDDRGPARVVCDRLVRPAEHGHHQQARGGIRHRETQHGHAEDEQGTVKAADIAAGHLTLRTGADHAAARYSAPASSISWATSSSTAR